MLGSQLGQDFGNKVIYSKAALPKISSGAKLFPDVLDQDL